jgi:hypothetical protein
MSLHLRFPFVAALGALSLALGPFPSASAQEEAAEEPAAEEPAAAEEEEAAPAEGDAEEAAPQAPRRKAAAAAAERRTINLYPEVPSVYWIADFEPRSLRMIAPREGLGAGRVYWYMIYDLRNTGESERDLFIEITATSDNGKTYSDMYLPSVERAIEKKEADPNLWGKTDRQALSSKRERNDPKYNYFTLAPGEKRRCVAVFNRLDPNANKITIRVAGLSNEIGSVAKDDGSKDLEERIREFYFERAGDEYAPTLDTFVLRGKDWVKRRIGAAVTGTPTDSAPGTPTDSAPGTPTETPPSR